MDVKHVIGGIARLARARRVNDMSVSGSEESAKEAAIKVATGCGEEYACSSAGPIPSL